MIEDRMHPRRNKPNRMSDAGIMVILVLSCSGGSRYFKHYQEYVCKHLVHLFPKRVSYNRFVEFEKEVLPSLAVFIKKVRPDGRMGISFCRFGSLRHLL